MKTGLVALKPGAIVLLAEKDWFCVTLVHQSTTIEGRMYFYLNRSFSLSSKNIQLCSVDNAVPIGFCHKDYVVGSMSRSFA